MWNSVCLPAWFWDHFSFANKNNIQHCIRSLTWFSTAAFVHYLSSVSPLTTTSAITHWLVLHSVDTLSHWSWLNTLPPFRSTIILREAGDIKHGNWPHHSWVPTHRNILNYKYTPMHLQKIGAQPLYITSAAPLLSTNLSKRKINFLINKVCLLEGLCCLQQQQKVLEATLLIFVQPLQSLW